MADNYDHPELNDLRAQATTLAGSINDLVQRASVYHHLYHRSAGSHCFPLLAAHGALWASGYFKAGMRFGGAVATAQGLIGGDRQALMASLSDFADQFRDINRRVCVETFFIYRLTERQQLRHHAERIVPPELLVQMDRCHAARIGGYRLADSARRDLFDAFFLWEQKNIVGPAIELAFASFDWPLIRKLALRPTIRFAYFDGKPLRFSNFGDTQERIVMGRRAFDKACSAGWPRVEQALSAYRIMPGAFAANPTRHFAALIESLSSASRPVQAFTSA